MADAIRRNAALVVGVAVCGFIFALAVPSMRADTGARGASLLHAQAPITAALVILGCTAVAVVVAGVVGRLVNTVVGLFVLGAGLFILANRGGTLQQLIFGGGTQGLLVFEMVLWAALVLAATLLVFAISGPLTDIEPEPSGRRPHWLTSKEAMLSAGAGVLVLPVVWVIAQSPLKGQTLAAATLGAMAAGLGGRLLSPHVQPKLLFASVCFFATVGHLVGWAMQDNPQAAVVAGTFSPWSLPMPVDYAAGALMGVAIGLGWAKSFLHHEETATQAVTRGG